MTSQPGQLEIVDIPRPPHSPPCASHASLNQHQSEVRVRCHNIKTNKSGSGYEFRPDETEYHGSIIRIINAPKHGGKGERGNGGLVVWVYIWSLVLGRCDSRKSENARESARRSHREVNCVLIRMRRNKVKRSLLDHFPPVKDKPVVGLATPRNAWCGWDLGDLGPSQPSALPRTLYQ